jgi:hypothetical protein
VDPDRGYVPPNDAGDPEPARNLTEEAAAAAEVDAGGRQAAAGTPAAAGRPSPKRRHVGPWIMAGALALAVLLLVGGLIMWRSFGDQQPRSAAPNAAVPGPVVASAQAKTVADLLSAYATDDRKTIESLLSRDNLPWTAPAPPIPAGIPKFLVQGMVVPQQQGTRWVLGNKDFLLVTLTGNGLNPTGTVDAVIEAGGQTRTATATLGLEGGKWKVQAIDGQPVADAVDSLLR